MNKNEPIPVYLEDVLDFLEREYKNPVDRWLRLRELLKIQKAAFRGQNDHVVPDRI